jgi:inosine/xanthosine triphosphatase
MNDCESSRDDGSSYSMSDGSSAWTLKVSVGTTNPSKLRAVENSLRNVFDDPSLGFSFHGYNVPSGVPNQPFGDNETRLGAQNRATEAFSSYVREHDGVEPDLAIGLEGGLEIDGWNDSPITFNGENEASDCEESSLICMAWMAVYGRRHPMMAGWALGPEFSRDNVEIPHKTNDSASYMWGWAKTSSFLVPPPISKLVLEEGLELGDADDQVFGRTSSKTGSGTVGVLTHGLIDRSAYYEHALILALVPWIRPDVYPSKIDSIRDAE